MRSRMNITATFERMASSAFFLAVGEASFLRELRKQGDCYQLVLMARALKKPTVLMLDRRLQPSEQAEIRRNLDGLEIIGTVFFDSQNPEERVKDELGAVLLAWEKRGKANE